MQNKTQGKKTKGSLKSKQLTQSEKTATNTMNSSKMQNNKSKKSIQSVQSFDSGNKAPNNTPLSQQTSHSKVSNSQTQQQQIENVQQLQSIDQVSNQASNYLLSEQISHSDQVHKKQQLSKYDNSEVDIDQCPSSKSNQILHNKQILNNNGSQRQNNHQSYHKKQSVNSDQLQNFQNNQEALKNYIQQNNQHEDNIHQCLDQLNQQNNQPEYIYQDRYKSNMFLIEPINSENKVFNYFFIPVTFADTYNYEQKVQQIDHLLRDGFTPKKLIKWIQFNNKFYSDLDINCQLLKQFQNDFIWKNIIPSMLDHVRKHSPGIAYGKFRHLTPTQYGNKKINIKRFDCYILLCQMFFGLIPIQQHQRQRNVKCTFGQYMHKQTIIKKPIKQIIKVQNIVFKQQKNEKQEQQKQEIKQHEKKKNGKKGPKSKKTKSKVDKKQSSNQLNLSQTQNNTFSQPQNIQIPQQKNRIGQQKNKRRIEQNNKIGQNEQNTEYLSDKQKSNIQKLKALFHYFRIMHLQQNLVKYDKQQIIIQVDDFQLKQEMFMDPNSKNKTKNKTQGNINNDRMKGRLRQKKPVKYNQNSFHQQIFGQNNNKFGQEQYQQFYGKIQDQNIIYFQSNRNQLHNKITRSINSSQKSSNNSKQSNKKTSQQNNQNSFYMQVDGQQKKQKEQQTTQNIGINFVNSFVQIDQFINQQQQQKQNRYYMNKYMFQRPQTFVIKLLIHSFNDRKSFISIYNCKRFAHCSYINNYFTHIQPATQQQLVINDFKKIPKLVIAQKQTYQNSVKQYCFQSIKNKLSLYLGLLKAMLKYENKPTVNINFDQFTNKDIYLNFLLMWIAACNANKANSYFIFKFAKIPQNMFYNIQKIKNYYMNKQIADILVLILEYFEFMNRSKLIFKNVNDLTFIQYIKRHVF